MNMDGWLMEGTANTPWKGETVELAQGREEKKLNFHSIPFPFRSKKGRRGRNCGKWIERSFNPWIRIREGWMKSESLGSNLKGTNTRKPSPCFPFPKKHPHLSRSTEIRRALEPQRPSLVSPALSYGEGEEEYYFPSSILLPFAWLKK